MPVPPLAEGHHPIGVCTEESMYVDVFGVSVCACIDVEDWMLGRWVTGRVFQCLVC